MSYQSGLEINKCTSRPGKCLCHTRVLLCIVENSYFIVFISYLPNFVTTTGHNFLKSGLSKSSVSVLTLKAFCIYTRLQMHVSEPGGIGNYIHIGIQVDTDNLITYHFLENL